MVNMGNYYAKQKQARMAQEWFARAVGADSRNPFAHIGLAIQSVRLEQRDKAIEHLNRAVELKPDFAEAYLFLAALAEQTGRKDEAKKYRRRFVPTFCAMTRLAPVPCHVERSPLWAFCPRGGNQDVRVTASRPQALAMADHSTAYVQKSADAVAAPGHELSTSPG
jgi:hypothetical protein